MTRFLCIWFPNWPIQRLLRCRPELSDRPVVLVANGPRGGVVAMCSPAASAQGVRPQMPLAEAQALMPELGTAAHDSAADRRALEKLAEACERFTPCVALEDCDEPESLLLDISNLEHLWGSEAELIDQVKKFFERRNYKIRLAAGDTVGAAWALAHYGKNDERTNDECILPFVIRHSSFHHLPVDSLRISPDTTALLRQLGVTTVGQLQRLPRESLSSRFGDHLLLRLDQFAGAAREVVEPHRAPPPWEAAYSLDEPTVERAVLMHVLNQLVNKIARQLRERDRGAGRMVCTFHLVDGQAVPLRVGLVEPSASARQLLELVELHLEAVRFTDEVDRVELRAEAVGRLGERQRELFADRWPSDSHHCAVLLNRLSSRLGEDRVLRAELRASAAPERAVRWLPVTAAGSRVEGRRSRARGARSAACKSAIHNPHPAIPLLLHPQPQSLEVVCIAPDGPPQFVWLDRRRERILHHVGPERIETLWWRGRSVRRDYYRIATEEGSHLWIFRELMTARWFLHGAFA